MAEKMPRTYKCVGYLKEVWQETFPNELENQKSKIQKRKEAAKLQREYEMHAEEID